MSRLNKFVMISFVMVLTACGENNDPVAFSVVNPQLDESGTMNAVADAAGDQPLTLMNAVLLQGVPSVVATTALQKFDQFKRYVANQKYIVMIDFRQHSSAKRLYLVHRASGLVEALNTAHGAGSDPNGDGYATKFSNVRDSRMSSLGSYLIKERYTGKWGNSMRLDGLESTNSAARARSIVMHPASYVQEGQSKQSWGCPAVPFAWIDRMIERLRDGSFMYIYGVNSASVATADSFFQMLELAPDRPWTNESDDAPADGESF